MELKFKELQIPKFQGQGEYLISPVELKDYIDWEVKRIYYITGVSSGVKTGSHCHKEEKELFVMLSGTCMAVIDRGNGLEEFEMKGPQSAMYIGNYVWHNFKDFSEGAVLLAITSTNYVPDRSDYIEDYEEYKKEVVLLK